MALNRLDDDQKLHERTTELERQNERLASFADVLSHDIRSPLSVAEARLTLVDDDCDSPHIGDIEQAHERMRTLVDDLLSLARDHADTRTTEAVDLAETLDTCWTTVKTDDATLLNELSGQIQADRGQLKRLFENLLRNAVEHGSTGSDGVTITAGALDDGFYVADDGPGIPANEREKIFESGYSTDSGTGLGLSIVRQIADAHEWSIRLGERNDTGTRFEITGVSSIKNADSQ